MGHHIRFTGPVVPPGAEGRLHPPFEDATEESSDGVVPLSKMPFAVPSCAGVRAKCHG